MHESPQWSILKHKLQIAILNQLLLHLFSVRTEIPSPQLQAVNLPLEHGNIY